MFAWWGPACSLYDKKDIYLKIILIANKNFQEE